MAFHGWDPDRNKMLIDKIIKQIPLTIREIWYLMKKIWTLVTNDVTIQKYEAL